MRIWLAGMMAMLAFSVNAQDEKDTPEKLTYGDHAPELGELEFIQGEPFKLADHHKRRVTIVEFWATWCAPCKESAPFLSQLYEKYKDTGLVVVGITDESPEVAKKYLEEMGDDMNYLVATMGGDTQKKYLESFGLEGIPYAFIIDKNGRVVWYGHPMNPFLHRKITPPLVAAIPEEFWPLTEELSHVNNDEKIKEK